MSKTNCFALLTRSQRDQIEKELQEYGFMNIKNIKDLIEKNQFKNKITFLDPEFCITLDCYIDPENPIFIDSNKKQIYSKSDLFAKFPFEEFGTTPEKMFRRQEIGLFIKKSGHQVQYEYLMRDQSDEDFVSLDDDIKRIIRKGHTNQLQATKIALTNIYLANEEWEEFCLMKKFIGGFRKFIPIEGGATIRQAIEAVPFFLASQTKGGMALLTDGSESKSEPRKRKRKSKKDKYV